ncbi:MAG: transcription antitermination factor NusB [Dehalococcoidia bacterium]
MAGSPRRRSRIAAFQALFEADVSGRDVEAALQRQIELARLSGDGAVFARHLAKGVVSHQAEIDAEIASHAPAFPLEDMAAVDRNVLRLAIFEVLFDNRAVPLRVVINEAVEIAKGYGAESSGRFVNGVLGAVALASSGESQQ